MISRIRTHITYANVMATIAVFIVLGGGAFAAVKLKKNAVKTKNIANSAVTTKKIADKAVTPAKVAPGALGAKVAAAAGTSSNDGLNGATGSQGIGANVCALFTLNATGVQPGDAVAITPNATLTPNVATVATVSYDGTAIPATGKLQVRVCSASTPYTINTGDLKIAWVAFR